MSYVTSRPCRAIHNYNTKEFSGGQLLANKDIGVLFRYIHKGFDQLGNLG